MKTLLKFETLTDDQWEEYCNQEGYDLDDYDERTWVDQLNFNTNLSILENSLEKIKVDEDIVVIADLGLWNGRTFGYKILSNNPIDILKGLDYHDFPEIEMNENNEIFAIDRHHDGTNYYRFRVWKKGISESAKEQFLYNTYNNNFDEDDILKHTKALKISKNCVIN